VNTQKESTMFPQPLTRTMCLMEMVRLD